MARKAYSYAELDKAAACIYNQDDVGITRFLTSQTRTVDAIRAALWRYRNNDGRDGPIVGDTGLRRYYLYRRAADKLKQYNKRMKGLITPDVRAQTAYAIWMTHDLSWTEIALRAGYKSDRAAEAAVAVLVLRNSLPTNRVLTAPLDTGTGQG